jgi:membrane-bound ClpP family serine protease
LSSKGYTHPSMTPSLLITLGIYFISCSIHIAVYRLLQRRQMRSAGVYGIGLAGFAVLWLTKTLEYPLTSITLFVLLSAGMIWISFGNYLGGETPASMILSSYKKKRSQTARELESLFTTRGLIWKRVDDLEKAGLVTQKNNHLRVTPKGQSVASCIRLYQAVFNRKTIG